MAIMDKPEDLPLDAESKLNATVTPFEEGENEEQENIELGPLVSFIKDKYETSKTNRMSDETRWLSAYRNYRGIYSAEVQFTDKEKSQAFVKITKTKVLASYAQIVDVLFAGAKFPVGIEPRTYSNNVSPEISFDPQAKPDVKKMSDDVAIRMGVYADKLEKVKDSIQEGKGDSPASELFEPAKKAAQNLEQKIHDQLGETEASKHLRTVAFEMSLFGTGILKGPFAFDKEYPKWNENGEYEPLFETIPKIEAVSLWNLYPDPAARSISECDYIIQRHRMNRSELRALKNRPFFRKDSIELTIESGASYVPEYWEDVLEDSDVSTDLNRYEVLEFWGMMDSELAEEAGLELPDGLDDQVQVNAWISNGQILRLVLNPFTPKRIPFHAVPYENNPYSFFGIGVAENMQDTQLLMNGFMRMAVDNAALSSNLLIEIDETNLVPGQNLDVYPGKVFRRQSGSPGQAIFGTKWPNVSNECLMMFDKARQLSDEATGMPSYAHGIGGVMGVGRTASGMSMLMGAAAQAIKSVVRNIDDYLLSPLGKALFSFNMQFNFDKEFLGDLEVKARGTESLMRNEVRSQRLLQFMQMSANPQMAPFVKYDYILRELAASMDLDEDKILLDKREAIIQAKLMADVQAMMPQQAGPPEGPPSVPPEQAPTPNTQGFTGEGGGANSPPQEGPPPPPPPQGPMQ